MQTVRTFLRHHTVHNLRARQGAAVSMVLLTLAGAGFAGGRKDPVTAALESALRAYRSHDLDAAQAWTQVAASLLDREATTQPRDQWQHGNTAQLLPLLDLYTRVAAGRDAVRDHDVFQLIAWLQQVERIHRDPWRPSECDGVAVEYDPFSNLVRKVGNVILDYDPFTLQIRKVGDFGIEYQPFTRQPLQIGPVQVDWDPFRPVLRSIGGVTLR